MGNSEQSVNASDGGVIKDVRQNIINKAENVYLLQSSIEIELTDDEIVEAHERYCQGMINRYGNLEFLGVLTRRDEGYLPLDKIFVELKAKRQTEKGKLPRDWHRYSSVNEALLQEEIQASNELAQDTQEILANHAQVVLIGQPGSGKSTLLKYLALMAAQDSHSGYTPLFIPITDYVKRCGGNSGQNLLDYLETFVCDKYLYLDPPLTKDFFLHQLREGHCLVFFDGFDEVTSLEERLQTRDEIAAFVAIFSKNRFILTSRPSGYAEAALNTKDFKHFEIQDFTIDEIKTFLTKWYTLRESAELERNEKIASLMKAIEERPGLKRMAVNPLLLTIIALIHRQEAELPNQRVKLYEKSVDVLLGSWENIKGLQTWQITEDERWRRLEYLAFWMYQANIIERDRAVEIEKEKLVQALAKYLYHRHQGKDKVEALSEAREFLELIRARTGLLVEKGRDIWGFVHLTFQEYLAAEDIIYRLNDSDEPLVLLQETILAHLHQPAWREVLLLTLSKLSPRRGSKALTTILKAKSEFEEILYRDLFFAADCLADDLSLSNPDEAIPIINQLVEIVLQGDLGPLITDAFKALTNLKGSPYSIVAMEILYQHVGQNKKLSHLVHFEVAKTFDELGGTEIAAQLYLDLIKNESIATYRRINAAQSLQKLNQAETAMSFLLSVAQNECIGASDRISVAQILNKTNKAEMAVNIYSSIIQNKYIDEHLKARAVDALGKLEQNTTAIDRLLLISQDKQQRDRVRSSAINALGNLKQAKTTELLISIAQDKEEYVQVRKSAIGALIGFEQTEIIINTLLSIAQDKQTIDQVRVEAITGLNKTDQTENIIDVLHSILERESETTDIRLNVAIKLSELGQTESGINILHSIVNDELIDNYIRLEGAKALCKLGQTENATNFLQTILYNEHSSNDWTDCIAAAETLGASGYSEIVADPLLSILQNAQIWISIRLHAAESLRKLNQAKTTIPCLCSLLQYPLDRDYRRSRILERIGKLVQKVKEIKPETIQVISNVAEDKRVDYYTRVQAAKILGELGQVEVATRVFLFVTQQSFNNSNVRNAYIEAVKALAGLNQSQVAIDLLLSIAQDKTWSGYWRLELAKTLNELGEIEKAHDFFVSITQDENISNYFRAQAFNQLGQVEMAANLILAFIQNEQESDRMRIQAIRNLDKFTFDQIEPLGNALLSLLQNERINYKDKVWIAEILGKFGYMKAVDFLLPIAQDECLNSHFRILAAKALGKLNQAEIATKVLLTILEAKSMEGIWRGNAAEALAELGPNPVVENVLLTLLQDEAVDKELRTAAAEALGELGQAETAIVYLSSIIEYPIFLLGLERHRLISSLVDFSQGESEVLEVLCNLIRDDQVTKSEKNRAYLSLKQLVSIRDLSQVGYSRVE